jgi:hypothetical protein
MMSVQKLFTPFVALGMLAACSAEPPTVNVAPGPAPNVTVDPPMVVVNPPETPPPTPPSAYVCTMGNDPAGNFLKCFNPVSGVALQDVSLGGNGGAGGNGGGLSLSSDGLTAAAVNKSSDNLAILSIGKAGVVSLTQNLALGSGFAPVSASFGPNAVYVLGATSVASYPRDGVHFAATASGSVTVTGTGSAQVTYLADDNPNGLAYSMKGSDTPAPGTGSINTLALVGSAIAGTAPTPVASLPSLMTPLGMTAMADRYLLATIAHGTPYLVLIRDGVMVDNIVSTQAADCWSTYYGGQAIVANTGGQSLSSYHIGNNKIITDAASLTSTASLNGGPSDIATDGNWVASLVRPPSAPAQLVIWSYDATGQLKPPMNVSVPATSNGVLVIPSL